MFFLTQEQAIVIIRIWYIIEHRANPSTIKKCCFFTSNSENSSFFWKFFARGASPPVPPPPPPAPQNQISPPPLQKSASCANVKHFSLFQFKSVLTWSCCKSDELPDIPDVGRYVFTDNFLENVWTPHNRYQLSPTLLFLSILYIGCKDGLGLYFNQSSLLFKKILS